MVKLARFAIFVEKNGEDDEKGDDFGFCIAAINLQFFLLRHTLVVFMIIMMMINRGVWKLS